MADTLYILSGTVREEQIEYENFINKIIKYINSCYLKNDTNNFIQIKWGGSMNESLNNKSIFINNLASNLYDAVMDEHTVF